MKYTRGIWLVCIGVLASIAFGDGQTGELLRDVRRWEEAHKTGFLVFRSRGFSTTGDGLSELRPDDADENKLDTGWELPGSAKVKGWNLTKLGFHDQMKRQTMRKLQPNEEDPRPVNGIRLVATDGRVNLDGENIDPDVDLTNQTRSYLYTGERYLASYSPNNLFLSLDETILNSEWIETASHSPRFQIAKRDGVWYVEGPSAVPGELRKMQFFADGSGKPILSEFHSLDRDPIVVRYSLAPNSGLGSITFIAFRESAPRTLLNWGTMVIMTSIYSNVDPALYQLPLQPRGSYYHDRLTGTTYKIMGGGERVEVKLNAKAKADRSAAPSGILLMGALVGFGLGTLFFIQKRFSPRA